MLGLVFLRQPRACKTAAASVPPHTAISSLPPLCSRWQVIALLDKGTLKQVVEGFDAHNMRKKEEAQRAAQDANGSDSAAGGGTLRAASSASEAAAVEDDGGLSKESDHYAVLGVAHDADERTISQAYRMASLRWHPDRAGGSKAAFQRVQQAYETLNEPSRRSDYDNGVKEERERENIYSSWRHLYCPFGDPFERKRKAKKEREAKAAAAAEAAAAKARRQAANRRP